jgi:hypothetical protein
MASRSLELNVWGLCATGMVLQVILIQLGCLIVLVIKKETVSVL